jgi:tetratricopeptide (TPR) repeat protein
MWLKTARLICAALLFLSWTGLVAAPATQESAVTAVVSSAILGSPTPLLDSPALTNPPVPVPSSSAKPPIKLVTNNAPANLIDYFSATNGLPKKGMSQEEWLVHLTQHLELARYLRNSRQPAEAEPLLVELLDDRSPELLKQSALLELAALAQDQNDLPRAQQVYAQFLSKWSEDLRVPEILLRQGMLFRKMGMYNLAFTKFYGVMTSALVLRNDQLDYYVRLVLQAQMEIAETQYELGKYADAADFFARLLKQNNSSINRSQITYKLTRCLVALRQYSEAVSQAQDFLARYTEAPEQPEMRFYLALALKEIGRNSESLQQVLLLLQEQRTRTHDRPELWAYWQQRAGNLIANQLYQEGDYTKALKIYMNLSQLDASPQWQIPVQYQIGMTYERLWQPQKATETYDAMLARESQLGAGASPELKTVFEMARWRVQFIQWQNKAEAINHQLNMAGATNSSDRAGLSEGANAVP